MQSFSYSQEPVSQWKVTREDLEKYGIDFYQFHVGLFSYKGDIMVGYEFMPLEYRKKGTVYGLRIFRFKPDGKFTMDTVLLPIIFMVSLTFADNEQSIIVVGNYGTKIVKVNLRSNPMKVETIFQHEPKKPGFRTENLVITWNNKVYLSGYFYDKDQYWEDDAIAELKIEKNDVKFVKTLSLTEAYKKLQIPAAKVLQVASGDCVYLAFNKAKKLLTEEEIEQRTPANLVCCNKGNIITIDKALSIGNFAATPDRIFYSAVRMIPPKPDPSKPKQQLENLLVSYNCVKNINDKKKWDVPGKNVNYTYPFISQDSKTMIFCLINVMEQKMIVFYAREKENFQPKVLLNEIPVSPMKLSGDGKAYLYMNPQEICVAYIEPPAAPTKVVPPTPNNSK